MDETVKQNILEMTYEKLESDVTKKEMKRIKELNYNRTRIVDVTWVLSMYEK